MKLQKIPTDNISKLANVIYAEAKIVSENLESHEGI